MDCYRLTNRAKGSLAINKSVLFWYRLISRSATVPGLYRGFLLPGDAGAAAVGLRGALVDVRPGVCLPPKEGRPPRPRRAVPDVAVRAMAAACVQDSE